MEMTKKKLPLNRQKFSELRELGFYYVDKTSYVKQMVEGNSKYVFLSRPRRFGKSLLVSTMDALFSGQKELFEGLDIYDQWDWSVIRPVIKLDFICGELETTDDLLVILGERLKLTAHRYKLPEADLAHPISVFLDYVLLLSEKYQQKVVVLIDEYDDPINSNHNHPTLAHKIHGTLREFYKQLKVLDDYIHFGFLTGITKVSDMGLYSGLNNLYDISLDPNYAAICGYTEEELTTVFAPEMESFKLSELQYWYNGYSWDGKTKVYNPNDVMLAFQEGKCTDHWVKTGSTYILVDTINRNESDFLRLVNTINNGAIGDKDLLAPAKIEHHNLTATMFQAGYLTIDTLIEGRESTDYILKVPNQEVNIALSKELFSRMGCLEKDQVSTQVTRIRKILNTNDFDALYQELESMYASVPHNYFRHNKMYEYEAYYKTLFQFLMKSIVGIHLWLEDSSSRGQSDITMFYNDQYYIFEFKMTNSKPKKKALQQIKDKGYADKYRAEGKPIHLIGIEFSRKKRTVVWYKAETLGKEENRK